MSTALPTAAPASFSVTGLPDHSQLPDTDGNIVHNFHEQPQVKLLTEAIEPVLKQFHPDGQYAMGADCGIYYRAASNPLDGCKAPDWFYVPNVPPMAPGGEIRRSYVLWQELVAPMVVVEIVSGDGSEEHDRTPKTGKLWIYEQAIRAPFYAIHDPFREKLEVFELIRGRYQPVVPNDRGHFPIPSLDAEFGHWVGQVGNVAGVWLRFFDKNGELLLTDGERELQTAARERLANERAQELAAQLARERQESERLRELLKAAGIQVPE